ncbi:glycosyltransferase family 2 protein [Pyrobaculum aerophilum]|uniref:glycosyltransferase family 2 protein n=1 Tax=Pyrobaculum aerophilum TaxID=13773 RepID=UPI0023F3F810|nr:glycosyltransferase [Pyrobaculum aerophilum]MCX8137679.1 glycosyltransferase [Pyrobaculum aerophilum]
MGDLICVLVPSYNRAPVIKVTLPTWLKSKWISRVIVIAESTSEEGINMYEEALTRLDRMYNKITYVLNKGRSGSVNARNKLLKLAAECNCEYAIMADDDYVLPNPEHPARMAKWLKINHVGAVGGRVIMINKRAVDPDFFLNTPIPIADALTKALGYVLLDVRNGPRYAEYLTPFYMVKREIINKIRYSDEYKGTAFREESDVHEQIKRLGYKMVIDPHVYVYHIGLEYGGNRAEISIRNRLYWKARNHTRFLKKWYKQPLKTWYLITSALILTLYRPWHLPTILKGIRNGLK